MDAIRLTRLGESFIHFSLVSEQLLNARAFLHALETDIPLNLLELLAELLSGAIDGAIEPSTGAAKRRAYRARLSTMKRAIAKLGSRAIPGNTKLGYALKAWRNELIEDLGGPDNISIQQRTIVEMASVNKMMISSVDAWIMSQSTLLTRDRTLIPVIMQRQQLVNGLVSMLTTLGLGRKTKQVTLEEILAEHDNDNENDHANANTNASASRQVGEIDGKNGNGDWKHTGRRLGRARLERRDGAGARALGACAPRSARYATTASAKCRMARRC